MAKPLDCKLAPWQHWAKQKPDEIALIVEQKALTWRELCAQIDGLTWHFAKSEQALALVIEPNYDYLSLIAMLSAWQQGVVTLLINSELISEFTRTGIKKFIFPHQLKARAPVNCSPEFNFDSALSIILSSGSTGLPKAVVHSARQHLFSAAGLIEILPFLPEDTWLLSLPLYHVSGLAIVWRWLSVGAKLKIANYKGLALLSAVQGATHASFVPSQLQTLVENQPDITPFSVLLGGATIPSLLVEKAKQQGIECWCGYGMTEMASTISAKKADSIDSVGRALAFRQIMLSSKGEVLVKGEVLALGYFKQGKVEPLAKTWFATKDKGCWLKNGQLSIIGRLDNMFISGGENIQPEQIEKVLSQFSGVGRVMVLPIKHSKWGQVPVALVENSINTEALLHFAKIHLAKYQVPQKILLFPSHLLDAGIKISRHSASQWLAKMQIDDK